MIDPFAYWSRAFASWQRIAATADAATKTATASREVIAARAGIMEAAMLSPLTADYPELARMVPEKVAAFSAAGTVMVDAWWAAQSACLASASRIMSRSISGRVFTPVDAMEALSDLNLDMLRAVERGSRLGRDALAPIHKAATSNARRLARRS